MTSGKSVLTAGKHPRLQDLSDTNEIGDYLCTRKILIDITSRVTSALLVPRRKLYAQSILDGMVALFPNAKVAVTDTHVTFYDEAADNRMCTIVKSGRTTLRTVGTTDITVLNKAGEVCTINLNE